MQELAFYMRTMNTSFQPTMTPTIRLDLSGMDCIFFLLSDQSLLIVVDGFEAAHITEAVRGDLSATLWTLKLYAKGLGSPAAEILGEWLAANSGSFSSPPALGLSEP